MPGPSVDRLEAAMRRALDLAERGGGGTAPNPMVGCVLLDDRGETLGEGWHARAGGPHAEVVALQEAIRLGRDPRGATAVVTLEPCDHHGRTPPCVDALLAAGVARVAYALDDPDVGGGGGRRLAAEGVEVISGLLAAEAADLVEDWLHHVATGRPFVHLKTALTMSGHATRGVDGERWITGTEARRAVHRLRHRHRAALVGIGTVLADDPRLTVRDWAPSGGAAVQPVRIVLDPRLRLPLEARLLADLDEAPLWVVTREGGSVDREARLRERGVEVVRVRSASGRLDLPAVLEALEARDVTGILAEPGPTLARALLAGRLVDRWTVFVAPDWVADPSAVALFGEGRPPVDIRLTNAVWRSCGRDAMLTGRLAP